MGSGQPNSTNNHGAGNNFTSNSNNNNNLNTTLDTQFPLINAIAAQIQLSNLQQNNNTTNKETQNEISNQNIHLKSHNGAIMSNDQINRNIDGVTNFSSL